MDAPIRRFGKDTGETERMLMEYLQQGKLSSESLLGTSICIPKVNPLFSPVSMMQNLNQKLLGQTDRKEVQFIIVYLGKLWNSTVRVIMLTLEQTRS